MRIKKLEICGFKSFVDRTVLHFDHEVTGVVGPNGCGKSNVVDAIRWVMGEQSAQRLRGKSMEDVIFNGSEQRKANGFAEVTITFDNSDGIAPLEYRDFAEIAVTRRLDRDGNSDYYVNKAPSRLLDVTQLFLGTGVGRNAYSIIEQGRIGFIVSSRPEDRRQIIEEAAGITKFKARKKAAERKMDQTRQNLLRVQDVLLEIEKSLASLRRQAQKAERYMEYRGELKDLELQVAAQRWLELTVTCQATQAELLAASEALKVLEHELATQEAQVEVGKAHAHLAEQRAQQAQQRAHHAEQQVIELEAAVSQRLEQLEGLKKSDDLAGRELSDLQLQKHSLAQEHGSLLAEVGTLEEMRVVATDALREIQQQWESQRMLAQQAEQQTSHWRTQATGAAGELARCEAVLAGFEARRQETLARRERLKDDRSELENRRSDTQIRASQARNELDELHQQQVSARQSQAELQKQLAELRQQFSDNERQIDQARQTLHARRSRLRSLEEIQSRYEGVGAGVRAIMTKFAADDAARERVGLLGMVADAFECPEQFTQAVAAALGTRLQVLLVGDVDAAIAATDFLRSGNLGRATLWPRHLGLVEEPDAVVSPPPDCLGRLSELVRCKDDYEPMLRSLLGRTFVFADLESALRVRGSGWRGGDLVTLQGEIVEANGAITGGTGEEQGAHWLEIQREVRALHNELGQMDEAMSRSVQRFDALRELLSQRQGELESATRVLHQLELGVVGKQKDAHRWTEELQRLEERGAAMDREVTELETAVAAAEQSATISSQEIEQRRSAKINVDEQLDGSEAALKELRSLVEHLQARLTDARLAASESQLKLSNHKSTMERLKRSLEALQDREKRLNDDLQRSSAQRHLIDAGLKELRENSVLAVANSKLAAEESQKERSIYDEARLQADAHDKQLRELRSDVDGRRRSVGDVQMRCRELQLAIDHLQGQVYERHRQDLRHCLIDFHARPMADAAVKARIDELQRLIERMGEINLMAIEEFAEQSTRHEFLQSQKGDLEEALEQLEQAIRQMNRESKQRFRETFEAVNERFKGVFPRMFGGGRAELKLTNPDDLLDTGVEIVAQPPGKKLGSLELMSGGEKALTAVSLIFAIFQYKPSPFCLLDEVDAPLDEANIGRFADAVRQMSGRSQFILITHSKRTMESVDVLYGVTMEQPGVSKLVSVELQRQPDQQRQVA